MTDVIEKLRAEFDAPIEQSNMLNRLQYEFAEGPPQPGRPPFYYSMPDGREGVSRAGPEGVPPEFRGTPEPPPHTLGGRVIEAGAQAIGTGLGAAYTTALLKNPAPGAMFGSTEGAMLGGQLRRWYEGQPTAPTDVPLDAAVGLATGAAPELAYGGLRAGARLLTGANASARREAHDAGLSAALATGSNNPLVTGSAQALAERDVLRKRAQASSPHTDLLLGGATAGGTLYSFLANDNIERAALILAGGATATYARRLAAEKILSKPSNIDFMMRGLRAGSTKERVLAELLEHGTEIGFDAQERQQLGNLLLPRAAADEPDRTLGGRSTRSRNPYDVVFTPSGQRGRDRVNGQFVSMGSE